MARIGGTPGQTVDCDEPSGGNRKQVMTFAWPKDWYAWTDRTSITTPDVTGPTNVGAGTPIALGDAGTIIIVADSSTASETIQFSVVLWDGPTLGQSGRNNPIAVSTGSITTSGWAQNEAGNYIGTNAISVNATMADAYAIFVNSVQGTFNLHHRIF